MAYQWADQLLLVYGVGLLKNQYTEPIVSANKMASNKTLFSISLIMNI